LIKKEHIDEIRSLGKPPPTVALVLQAACIMADKPQEKMIDKNSGKPIIDKATNKPIMVTIRIPMKNNPKQTDWWATAQKWMSNTNQFMADLTTHFKSDAIDPDVIDKIKDQFLTNPDFDPKRAAQANKACEGMCKWIIKIVAYDKLIKLIRPLKQAMGDAVHDWNNCMAELNIKQQEL